MTADGFRDLVLRGVGWTALKAWVLRLSGLLVFVVLGRTLTPAEIGTAALALGIVGLTTLLADVGVPTWLIRAERLEEHDASTAFWLTLAQSLLTVLLLQALAGPLAALLGIGQLEPLLRVLSVNLLLHGLTAVSLALLLRELQLRRTAVREIFSGIGGGVAGVAAALAGAGVWALVVQSLVQGTIALVLLWTLHPWRPARHFARDRAGHMLRFGLPLFGTGIVQSLRDRVDQVLLGVVAGPALLGYWAVATRLLAVGAEVTVAVLDHVALPVFSRRRDRDQLPRALENATALSAGLLGPAVAVLAATAPALVPLLFGDQWGPAIVPAQLLCAAYGLGALTYFNRAAYLARGRAGLDLLLTGIGLAAHVVTVVVAAPYGLVVLSAALVGETALLGVLHAVVGHRVLALPWSVLARGALALVASAVAFAAMAGVGAAAGSLPAVPLLTLQVCAGALAYLAALSVLCPTLLREVRADLDRLRGTAGRP